MNFLYREDPFTQSKSIIHQSVDKDLLKRIVQKESEFLVKEYVNKCPENVTFQSSDADKKLFALKGKCEIVESGSSINIVFKNNIIVPGWIFNSTEEVTAVFKYEILPSSQKFVSKNLSCSCARCLKNGEKSCGENPTPYQVLINELQKSPPFLERHLTNDI